MEFRHVSVLQAEIVHAVAGDPTGIYVDCTLGGGGRPFVLFACHWKSKSGGAQKSELWRDLQECLLARRIREVASAYPSEPLIVCGDFNRALEEFNIEEDAVKGKTVSMAYDLQPQKAETEREHAELLSAWFIGGGSGGCFFWEKRGKKH